MLLAGDIGGTKINLAVYEHATELQKPLVEATFPSSQYPSLEALVRDFLTQYTLKVDRASFGVAGPVVNHQATITNLPWVMDETQLQEALHIPSVRLLNDLEAIAHAVPFLGPDDLRTLNVGQPVRGGAIAVIAPGTGLGEAFLTWERSKSKYQSHTSEGGHADFAPSNALEIELLRYLFDHFTHVSFERVCSGRGIPNIYKFLKESGYAEESPALAEQLVQAADLTPIIFEGALNAGAPDALCVATLNTFVSILGAEAGNLALKVLATGGVYLGGGIPPRILSLLEEGHFMQAFQRKGRFTDLLGHVPVHVILNPKIALLGAAYHGLEMEVH